MLDFAGFCSTNKIELGSIREESCTVVTADGVQLGARWTLPVAPTKGVLVLLQGSGNVGMDGDVSSPFVGSPESGKSAQLSEQLAVTLAAHGVASLRFSKRGFEDPDQLKNQTIPFLMSDAQAALQMAKARFPGLKCGYVGFSEGAIVAVAAAAQESIDALFLLAPITRSIDQTLAYQFIQWPVDLLRKTVDLNRDGILSAEERTHLSAPPLLGLLWPSEQASWSALLGESRRGSSLSIAQDLIPAYQRFFLDVLAMLQSPGLEGWIQSLREMAPFAVHAAKITAPVYIYQALDDSQVDWSWISLDRSAFAGPTDLKCFAGLGHCFSRFEGSAGEVKTSGPFDSSLLQALGADLDRVF